MCVPAAICRNGIKREQTTNESIIIRQILRPQVHTSISSTFYLSLTPYQISCILNHARPPPPSSTSASPGTTPKSPNMSPTPPFFATRSTRGCASERRGCRAAEREELRRCHHRLGVRGGPKLTVFFEETLNAVKCTRPTAQLLFNSSPPSTLDAVKRNFPL